MRRLVVQLAIRLNRLPHEIEQLQMTEVAELLAVLTESEAPPDVEQSLIKAFTRPK